MRLLSVRIQDFRRIEDSGRTFANTQKIEVVVANGRLLDRKALDSLLVDAETAVKSK